VLLGHLSRKVGWADLQVIRVVIVLLIFGPGRLPEMMGPPRQGFAGVQEGTARAAGGWCAGQEPHASGGSETGDV